MHKVISRILFLLFVSSFLAVGLQADSPEAAKQRITARLPQIDSLKIAGEVGEDANGYLVKRKELGPRQSSLVDAENMDRMIGYKSIAERTNQTVDEVGRQRAIQTALRTHSGVWLQKPSGEWYQKE